MELSHMDEFIDELLREDRACDVILPRIQVRSFSCEEIWIYSHVNYIWQIDDRNLFNDWHLIVNSNVYAGILSIF